MKIPANMTRREALKWGAKLATIGLVLPSPTLGANSPALLKAARSRNASPALIANAATTPDVNGGTTAAINTTGANLIIFAVAFYNAGGTQVGTLSDSKGNTWTALTSHANGSITSRLYYCYNPTVGSGHTFSYTSVTFGIYGCLTVAAFSGFAASPFDLENGATATSASSISTGSITPSQARTVVFAAAGFDTGTAAIDNGFTITDAPAIANASFSCGLAYKVLSAVAATNPQWSFGASNGNLGASIIGFKY